MKAAAGTLLGPHLRRKSTAAILMTNELRRSSRVSTNSFDQANYFLGPDGLSFYGINLVPFRNGFRYNLSGTPSRKTSTFVAAAFQRHQNTKRKGNDWGEKTRLQKMTDTLLSFYEKSRIHYLLPILVLVIYSFLGGAIFYTIESPAEQSVLMKKKEYVNREERHILAEVIVVEKRLRQMRHFYYNNTNNNNWREAELLETFAHISTLNREIQKYRKLAMNRIYKAIYWYVLQSYYLNDQETYKSSLLNPSNPEKLWKAHFQSSPGEPGIGRIIALKNYTQQLAKRCWELGYETHGPEQLRAKLRKSIEEFNKFVGLQHTLTPTWTFWNSMFLAVTTYSTIGYGNIVPKTNLGKFFAMIYAVIGIPMTFMILHKLGRFFLLCLEYFWHKLIWLMEFVSCVKDAEKLKGKVRGSGGMPVLLAIGVAFSWMFLCAAIFLQFEQDWDYFKSFYFFFCSLTTIGYGDVTPTNSEDMFIMFGFIIVGLSLVSMCINVIQLKLEELFEELLLTMMEEYGDTGQTVEEITAAIKPRMSLVDLWKVWKRRRQRQRSMQITQHSEEGIEPIPPECPEMIDQIMLAPQLASRQQQWQNSMSEGNLRRMIKLFPYGKMRREEILRKLQLRFNQHSKATQTDLCCVHGFRYQPDLHLLSYTTRELDEEETLTNNSSAMSTQTNNDIPQQQQLTMMEPTASRNNEGEALTISTGSGSSLKNNLRVNVSSSVSSSSPIALSTSSSSSTAYIRRYLPSNSHHQLQLRRLTALSAQTRCSVHSAPNGQPCSSGTWQPHPTGGGGRRWTFFESGKTPRGAPRGLAVPYMYTKKRAKAHETTEVRRLIAEIDSRLLDCRTLVSPCSRSISRTSTATSPSIP